MAFESLFCKIEFAVTHKNESPLGALFCKIKKGSRTLIISVFVALRYNATIIFVYTCLLFLKLSNTRVTINLSEFAKSRNIRQREDKARM